MRRIKMILTSAVVTVAMLIALAGPAMAHDRFVGDRFVGSDFCCDRLDDRFHDRGLLFLRDVDDDDDCDVEDVDRLGNVIFVVVECD